MHELWSNRTPIADRDLRIPSRRTRDKTGSFGGEALLRNSGPAGPFEAQSGEPQSRMAHSAEFHCPLHPRKRVSFKGSARLQLR